MVIYGCFWVIQDCICSLGFFWFVKWLIFVLFLHKLQNGNVNRIRQKLQNFRYLVYKGELTIPSCIYELQVLYYYYHNFEGKSSFTYKVCKIEN